jgi:hypothetical protein
MTVLKSVPESGPLVEKKASESAVSVSKVTKAEEAIFSLRPGKDALVRLAAALQPFAPVFDFVSEGIQVRNETTTRKKNISRRPKRYAREREDDTERRADDRGCDDESTRNVSTPPAFCGCPLHAAPQPAPPPAGVGLQSL